MGQQPGLGGLRDRYGGAMNQDPRQAAPGLNNRNFSPGRSPIGSPGGRFDQSNVPQRTILGQQPQPTQAQS